MAIDPNEYLRERTFLPLTRAERQSNINFAFNELGNELVQEQRLAKKPAKQSAKIRRRQRNAQKAVDAQKFKDTGALRANQVAAAQLYAQMWTDTLQEQLNPTRSLSGVKKRTRNAGVTRVSREARQPFNLRVDYTAFNAVPNPSTMTDRQLENYARKMILSQKRNSLEAIAEEIGGISKADIQIQAIDLYNQERAAMRKQYGPGYRAKLREMATSDLRMQQQNAARNLTYSLDGPQPPRIAPENDINYKATRLPTGTPDPNSLANVNMNRVKKDWMLEDERMLYEGGQAGPRPYRLKTDYGFGEVRQGKIIRTDMSNIGKEQAVEAVKKAPISAKTAARSMNAYMLAAGVAAGGLGVLYGFNRQRAEQQVGM